MVYLAHIRQADSKQEKTIQTIEEHLFQVSRLASQYAGKINMAAAGELLGLLHDLGKYSKSFQSYIGSASGIIDQDAEEYVDAAGLKGKIDHSTAGAQYLWRQVEGKGMQQQIAAQMLALCLASHHSGLIDCLSPEGDNKFAKRMETKDSKSKLTEVQEKADIKIREKINEPEIIENFVNEVIIFLRKIAKTENSERSIKAQFQYGLLIRLLFSCLIDADRMDTANFENPKQARNRQNGRFTEWDVLIERLESKLEEFSRSSNISPIDHIRKSISDACLARATENTGVFTLTVPTGGGKTLASLRFAMHHARKHHFDRIIYVIPYTSIIDQNAQVVRNILETKPAEAGRIVLEHHSNLTPEIQNWKNKILTENWDAPIVFTTSVQLLETLFAAGTRSARRMHQLANSLLIFDEIQTLPVRTVHLFCNAVNFLTAHCHTSVVLCTATQPLLNKVSDEKGAIKFDASNEIMPNVSGLFDDLKRVDTENRIKPQGWTTDEIANLAKQQMATYTSCLVIVNTKKNAQAIYEACKYITDAPIIHLSTSMCPAHRMEKLSEIKKLLETGEPLICISTQLIEAGVDVDFGSVIRFVAGLDSIAQAAGRCNRNGKRKSGKVLIVNPAIESIDSLAEIKVGKEMTERILREMHNPESGLPKELIHPETTNRYFQYYFYNRAGEMSYTVDAGHTDTLLNMLSLNGFAVEDYKRVTNGLEPKIYFRQAFKSAAEKFQAIDALTRGIVVPYGKVGSEIVSELFSQYAVEKQFQVLKRAQRYTVNVFPNVLKKLMDAKALREVPEIGVLTLSDPRYYHPEFGLSTEMTKDYELLNC